METVSNILLLEDDISLNEGIKFVLTNTSTVVRQATTLEEARKIFDSSINLILLDINLPDGNGLDFCVEVRKKSKVPIIFISANDTDIDIIKGLELGGDEYIIKPFNLMVLRAKVDAIIRRTNNNKVIDFYKNSIYFFDFDKMIYYVEDEEIFLSSTDQKILKILVQNEGNIINKFRLIEYAWGIDSDFIEENSLVSAIKRLRKKIKGKKNTFDPIQTVYGIGYRWSTKENE